jgi:hypothetical protein
MTPSWPGARFAFLRVVTERGPSRRRSVPFCNYVKSSGTCLLPVSPERRANPCRTTTPFAGRGGTVTVVTAVGRPTQWARHMQHLVVGTRPAEGSPNGSIRASIFFWKLSICLSVREGSLPGSRPAQSWSTRLASSRALEDEQTFCGLLTLPYDRGTKDGDIGRVYRNLSLGTPDHGVEAFRHCPERGPSNDRLGRHGPRERSGIPSSGVNRHRCLHPPTETACRRR